MISLAMHLQRKEVLRTMYKRIKFLLIAFLTFCLLVTICHFLFRPIISGNVYNIENGWSVEYKGETYTDISLRDIPKKLGYGAKREI